MDATMVDYAKSGEGEASLEKSLSALIELSRCPICKKLLNEATTINLCTHTFCRKCIYPKLKETNCCPKCNQELETSLEEHLIADDYKNSLATKVRDSLEKENPAKLQADDHVTSPKFADVSLSKTIAKLDDAGVSETTVEESSGNVEDYSKKDEPDRICSQESSTFPVATQEKNLGKMTKIAEDVPEAGKGTNVDKKKSRNEKDKKAPNSTPEKSGNVEVKISDGSQKGKEKTVDAQEKQHEASFARMPLEQEGKKANYSIWFSLVPQMNEDGHAFPPLERPNIRVRNNKMTISIIQKYLKTKLNLNAETQVDILCRGRKLNPEQNLNDIEEIWKSGLPGGGKPKAKWKINEVVIELVYTKSRDSTAAAN